MSFRFGYVFVGYHTRPRTFGEAHDERGLTKPLGDVLYLTDDEASQVRNNMSGGGIDLISIEADAR